MRILLATNEAFVAQIKKQRDSTLYKVLRMVHTYVASGQAGKTTGAHARMGGLTLRKLLVSF